MSLSYRKFTAVHRRYGRCAGAVLAMLGCASTASADTYFQPEVSAQAEYNSNRNMATVSELEESMPGYRAKLQGTWGIRSEISETLIRPRVELLAYPDEDGLQRSEQFLDFRSTRDTQRGLFRLFGKFSRQDTFNSELADAEFDDLDPDDPAIPETGEVAGGTTRNRYQVRTEFGHRVGERTTIGARLGFQASRFEEEQTGSRVDYDDFAAGLLLTHELDERTEISFTPYVSMFETTDGLNRNDSLGVELGWTRAWTERYSLRLLLDVQRSDIEIRDAITGDIVAEESTTDYGPGLQLTREGEVSRLRLNAARTFRPTNRGSKSVVDQIWVQYERDLSERLEWTLALRAYLADAQGDLPGASDYEHLNGLVALRWSLSRTWFLRGGYNYYWRDHESEAGSAANNAVFIEIGYRGLGPQR